MPARFDVPAARGSVFLRALVRRYTAPGRRQQASHADVGPASRRGVWEQGEADVRRSMPMQPWKVRGLHEANVTRKE